ncbi:MAG: alpha/beta fold hydrolase [Ferruginibacter sp.]
MKTFILIHGSWHSSWNWHKVVPLLKKSGHHAIAIDLPGMGRDKTPIMEVKMEKTVEKICALVDSIEGEIILVGHSKNGIMISQVAEYRPNRITKLIYLAAYLVPGRKSQREYSAMDTEGWLKPYVVQSPETKSYTLHPDIYKEGLYHDCTDDIVEMAKCILSHEPVESGSYIMELSENRFGSVPRYYIECTQDRAVTPYIQQLMYTEMPCKKVYSMDSSHSPFFSRPGELVKIFNEIALMNED